MLLMPLLWVHTLVALRYMVSQLQLGRLGGPTPLTDREPPPLRPRPDPTERTTSRHDVAILDAMRPTSQNSLGDV
jgi:hypothetical protein